MRLARPGILFTVLLWSSTVLAHPDVEEAKKAFARGEFKLALMRLDKAERAPDRSDDDTIEMLWVRGATLYRLGKKADADRSFDQLLASRPLYEPDKYEVAPDLRKAFGARAQAYDAQHGVRLGPPTLVGDQLVVVLEKNAGQVASLRVFTRVAGDLSYQPNTWRVDGGQGSGPVGAAALWERLARGGNLEVAVEALNERGAPVARLGDAANPQRVTVSPEAAQAVLEALAPKPAPAPAPVAQNPAPTAAAVDETPASSPLRMPLMGGGGAVLAGGGVVAIITLVAGVAAVALWAAFAGTWYTLSNTVGVQSGANYQNLTRIYQYSLWPAVALSGVGAVLLLATLGLGGAGAGLLAAGLLQ